MPDNIPRITEDAARPERTRPEQLERILAATALREDVNKEARKRTALALERAINGSPDEREDAILALLDTHDQITG